MLSLLNALGTFHDTTMADYSIYDALQSIFCQCGTKVVVDSAFKMANANFLVRSTQVVPQDLFLLRINQAAISVRQLSEWGM